MKAYEVLQRAQVAAEAIAFLAGIINWHKVKNTYWKWFVYYCGLIVLCETTGLLITYYYMEILAGRNFYNYFVIPLEFFFFFWLFFKDLKKGNKHHWPLSCALVYCIAFLVNGFIFPDVLFWSVPVSYMVGVISLLILSLLFFILLARGGDILNYKTNMMFWVCLGVLVFFLISSPFFALRQTLWAKYRDVFWPYYYLQFAVNYLMYLFFATAFIWGKTR
jgi:hypothetical protein